LTDGTPDDLDWICAPTADEKARAQREQEEKEARKKQRQEEAAEQTRQINAVRRVRVNVRKTGGPTREVTMTGVGNADDMLEWLTREYDPERQGE
jgi:hypothetical protein